MLNLKMETKLSVIIPAYNAEAFLASCITHVREQGLRDYEILLVDDGSSDSTEAIARDLADRDLTYIHQSNRGPAAARNAGIERATGEFIGFLDVDDLWFADSLHRRIDFLSAAPGIDAVTTYVQYENLQSDGCYEAFGKLDFGFNLGAHLFRRRVFSAVGYFDPELKLGEDVDWLMRAREAGLKIGQLAEPGLHYRFHGGNLTGDMQSCRRYFAIAVKRSLDRRRKAAQ